MDAKTMGALDGVLATVKSLAINHPEVVLPGLAQLLHSVAASLDEPGNRPDGGLATEAAREIQTSLGWFQSQRGTGITAASESHAQVSALVHEALKLAIAGDYAGSVAVTRRVIELRRARASSAGDHEAYAELSDSLRGLAMNLITRKLGSGREESEEALSIARWLYSDSGGAFEALLSHCLFARAHARTGSEDRRRQLELRQESVALGRHMAAKDLNELGTLAQALGALALGLLEAGALHDALPAAEESVRTWRQVMLMDPEAADSLAGSLITLSMILGALDRDRECDVLHAEVDALHALGES